MGYEGLIITDDIEMKAVAEHYGYDDAAIRGLNAGVDNFLCCHTAEVALQLIDTVALAFDSGRVSKDRLLDANRRVAAFIERWAQPAQAPSLHVLRSEEHLSILEEIRRRVDPALAQMGEDPTEVMERSRVERTRPQGLHT